jgi:hypothetical protein
LVISLGRSVNDIALLITKKPKKTPTPPLEKLVVEVEPGTCGRHFGIQQEILLSGFQKKKSTPKNQMKAVFPICRWWMIIGAYWENSMKV